MDYTLLLIKWQIYEKNPLPMRLFASFFAIFGVGRRISVFFYLAGNEKDVNFVVLCLRKSINKA